MHRRFPLLVALLLTIAITALAQDDDVVRVNTELVVLNITVTDKDGQYVPGLKLSDFTKLEDGKPVPVESITGFSMQESQLASGVLLDTTGSMETSISMAV